MNKIKLIFILQVLFIAFLYTKSNSQSLNQFQFDSAFVQGDLFNNNNLILTSDSLKLDFSQIVYKLRRVKENKYTVWCYIANDTGHINYHKAKGFLYCNLTGNTVQFEYRKKIRNYSLKNAETPDAILLKQFFTLPEIY